MIGEIGTTIIAQLDLALALAEAAHATETTPDVHLSAPLIAALDVLSANAQSASAAFTNIITCLSIKAANPEIDIRYHQVQIQHLTPKGAGFNFRGLSEDTIYPWLSHHRFEGAKSGWQTRTLERPKPYTLDYDENIGRIKSEFLAVFDRVEEHGESAANALAHLIYKQVIKRELSNITLSVQNFRISPQS
jgi:DNA (cytosine-5)-methyltransferase 1